MRLREGYPGWRIEVFEACWWIVLGKYVLRIGKPWSPYRYAWRPLFQFFKAFR